MRTPTLFLAAVGTGVLLANATQAENSISWEANKYTESDQRIRVRGGALTVKHDFGTDYELTAGMDYDTVSGATPMWVPIPGYSDQFEKGKVRLETESRDAAFASVLMRDKNRHEYTATLAYSEEPDFIARTLSLSALLWQNAAHNRSYNLGFSHSENTAQANAGTTHKRDEDSRADYIEVGISQVINAGTTLDGSVFYGRETGYQSNQYLRIVRQDEYGNRALAPDSRPEKRESAGFTLRAIHAFSNELTAHVWYRFYEDDWDISGHTLEARAYWTILPQVRLNPVVRFGNQTEADFFRDYGDSINTFASSGYGSNDERLGHFDTDTFQLNAEWLATKEWTLNIGFTQYTQSNGFEASWYTGGFVFKY